MAQVTPLWGALAVLLAWAVRQRRAPLIGLCLVLLPAKPQAGLVLALLVAGWCLWRERRALVWALVFGLPLWGGSAVLLLLHPDWLHDWLARLALYSSTIPSNLSGDPAVSVPYGVGDDGLPVGVQVMAPALQEATMLRVAATLEASR